MQGMKFRSLVGELRFYKPPGIGLLPQKKKEFIFPMHGGETKLKLPGTPSAELLPILREAPPNCSTQHPYISLSQETPAAMSPGGMS